MDKFENVLARSGKNPGESEKVRDSQDKIRNGLPDKKDGKKGKKAV